MLNLSMKKKDLYSFSRGLELLNSDHMGFTYSINRNKRNIKPFISDMDKTIEPNEKIKEYRLELEKINKKYAEKDDNGNPKIKEVPSEIIGKNKKVWVVPDAEVKGSKYNKEVTALNEKYKEHIDKYSEKLNRFKNKFLEEETEFVPYKISREEIKNERCPQHIMDLIHWMIDG